MRMSRQGLLSTGNEPSLPIPKVIMTRFTSPLIVLSVFTCVLLTLTLQAHANVTGSTRMQDDRQLLVLENNAARLTVDPQIGGAIVEYLDKATGHDFVAGEVKPGNVTWGWKEVTSTAHGSGAKEQLVSQSYDGRFVDVPAGKAIVVTCVFNGLRSERQMQLAADSAELTVNIRYTNVSDKPRTIWPRWHPYMKLDDARALTSVIIAPEGPQDPGSFRKIRVGQGWDQHFLVSHGFWLTANYQSGLGLWMTFDKQDVPIKAVWTDYKMTHHPGRGNFICEIFPRPRVIDAGSQYGVKFSYLPFVASKVDPATMSMGVLEDASEQQAARQFLSRVIPNLSVIGPHTMQARPAGDAMMAIQQNRFTFSHRRRDRAALEDWGFVDAMMAIPADQSMPVRMRHFAQAFHNQTKYFEVRFVLTITSSLGDVVKTASRSYPINPNEYQTIDMRDDVAINDLPDGRYTFTLEAFQGKDKRPLHIYRETRKLVGQQRLVLEQQRLAAASRSLEEQERPVVRALRTMEIPKVSSDSIAIPLAVEEASGTERRSWPVTTGVPFSQGVLPKGKSLSLTDAAGKTVPLQTHVQGIWPDGSARWVLVDFPASTPANGHSIYTLRSADASTTAANIATQQNGSITIDTGSATYQLDDKLMNLFPADGLWWTRGDGKTYHFAIRGQNAGIVLEENGPQRAAVKVTGWYFSPEESRPVAMGELRFEFYRGQSWFRLNHTVTYTGEPWSETLGSYGATFQFAGRAFTGANVELDGKAVSEKQKISLLQTSEEQARVTRGPKNIVTGQRTQGGSYLAGEKPAGIYLREAWKLFPKQIDVDATAGRITYHYWPAAAGAMSFVPREDGWLPSSSSPEALGLGMGRTMELVIDPQGQFGVEELATQFEEPVLAIVPPRYVSSTGVLPDLQPYDPAKLPELERLIRETIETYQLNQVLYGWYGHWFWGSIPNVYRVDESRWADYGRYAHLLNEQNITHGLWLAYLRSGDRMYYNFARPYSRHLMDVGTIRWDDRWPDAVGLSRRHHETIWLSAGDYGHSMLDPFVEDYHITGHLPAWQAAQRMADAMARQKTGSWRYLSNPIIGLARMYLETQQGHYKQQADQLWNDLANPDRGQWYVGDHGCRMAVVYGSINPQVREEAIKLETAKPGTFSTLDFHAAYHRLTGDERYQLAARKQFDAIIKKLGGSQTNPNEPLRWGARTISQFNLAHVREMCYGSAVLATDVAKEQP